MLHNTWRTHLQACQLILTWTPKLHRAIFVTPPPATGETAIPQQSTESAPADETSTASTVPLTPDPDATAAIGAGMGFVANDPRLRRLPVRARNITYAHVKQLQREFSVFRVFGEPFYSLFKRLLLLLLLNHRKRLRMIHSRSCAPAERRTSPSRDAPGSSLWRSASKAGQRSHKWSSDSSSLSHRRHIILSDRSIRFCQHRGAGWQPLRQK